VCLPHRWHIRIATSWCLHIVARPATVTSPAADDLAQLGADIVLDRVVRRYGDIVALDGISLAVPRGSLLGVI
jgi:hypothetical protein